MTKPSPHRETNLYFDKIIIGSSVEAMITAFKYGIPVFGDIVNKPLPFSYIPHNTNLSGVCVKNESEKFVYISGKTDYKGISRVKLWDILVHRLSISGLAPMFGNYTLPTINLKSLPQFHLDGESNILKLHVKDRSVNIHVKDKMILFDYPKYQNSNKLFMVNDIIKLHSVYDLDTNLYISEDCDFLNTLAFETIFYKRDKKMHNCCVKSIIPEDVINDWKYSSTAIRLITEKTIFWNIDKQIKVALDSRQMVPLLIRMCESIEDILEKDILDEEIYG